MLKKLFIAIFLIFFSTTVFTDTSQMAASKKLVNLLIEGINSGKKWGDLNKSLIFSKDDIESLKSMITGDQSVKQEIKNKFLKAFDYYNNHPESEEILSLTFENTLNKKICTLDKELDEQKKRLVEGKIEWSEFVDEVNRNYHVNVEGKFTVKLVKFLEVSKDLSEDLLFGKKYKNNNVKCFFAKFEVKSYLDNKEIPKDFYRNGSGNWACLIISINNKNKLIPIYYGS